MICNISQSKPIYHLDIESSDDNEINQEIINNNYQIINNNQQIINQQIIDQVINQQIMNQDIRFNEDKFNIYDKEID